LIFASDRSIIKQEMIQGGHTMKKIYSVVLTVLLVFALSMTVSASVNSPVKGEVTVTGGSVTLKDGNVVSGTEVGTLVSVNKGTTASAGGSGLSSVSGTFDISLSDDVESATVQVYLAGVNVGDTVTVRVYLNGQWVDIEGAKVVAKDTVEIPVTAAGTYDVLVSTSSAGAGTGDGSSASGTSSSTTSTSSTNSSTTSPKTGEGAQFPAAVAAVVVFGACAVLSGRKARKAA
jgi:hypothetical protein